MVSHDLLAKLDLCVRDPAFRGYSLRAGGVAACMNSKRVAVSCFCTSWRAVDTLTGIADPAPHVRVGRQRHQRYAEV